MAFPIVASGTWTFARLLRISVLGYFNLGSKISGPVAGVDYGDTKVTLDLEGIKTVRPLATEMLRWPGVTEIFEQHGNIFFLSGKGLMSVLPSKSEARPLLLKAGFVEVTNPWAEKGGDIRTWKRPSSED